MFDLGWSEIVVIGVVALIAIGPKELPGALRALGQWAGKIRRMSADFQGQFRDAMREAEFADLKKQADDATSEVASAMGTFTNYDPLATPAVEPPASPESADAPPAPEGAGPAADALPPQAEQTDTAPVPEPSVPATEVNVAEQPPSQKSAGSEA